MAFYTDQQTLDDLNVFGSISENAVFQIYNHCVTRGGAMVLQDMFSLPLSDHAAINRRSSIIQYFALHGVAFPLKGSDFDAIDQYMDNTDERSRLGNQQQSIGQKLSRMIAADAQTVTIEKGISALKSVFHDIKTFVLSEVIQSASVYEAERKEIDTILAIPVFAQIFAAPKNAKIQHQDMVELDAAFRFRHRYDVLRLLSIMNQLDVYISVAGVAAKRGFIFPVALAGKRTRVELKDLYHPAVKNAVANDVHIDENSNVIFLTGANMAGKSTFMKSLSLALFLAHMGFPVAAASMRFNVLGGMFTTINLPDNLGLGASHFYAEVLRLKKVAYELSFGKRLFVVFDELFRGTNVRDAYEATIEVAKAFAERRDSVFVISTHIIEVGDVLATSCDNIQFLQLPTRMDGHSPVYTYRLEQGVTSDRHGMVIVENEGIVRMLMEGLKNERS